MQMSLSEFLPSRCHEQSDDKYDMNNESLFLSHHDPLAPHTQTQQGEIVSTASKYQIHHLQCMITK